MTALTTGLVLALAGGVGGAKLALGLSRILPPERLAIVVNTGDDERFHGLHVSPDVDTMTYTLSGLYNPETGWGIDGDTFETLQMLNLLGADTWFNLGSRDFAMHIRRTELLLNQGIFVKPGHFPIDREFGHPSAPHHSL